MNVVEFIKRFYEAANLMLDVVFLVAGVIVLYAFPFYYFFHQLKKNAKEKHSELLTQSILLFLILAVFAILWALPEIVSLILVWIRGGQFAGLWDKWKIAAWWLSTYRLILAFAAFFVIAWLFGHEHGKNRWLISALSLIGMVLLGWAAGRWVGLVFISAPMIAVYFATLHDLALVIMPASDPEDKAEQKKRVNAFISYTWGIQSPMVWVDDHAWKKYEPRIPGDITWRFSDFPIPIIQNLDWRPGMVWSRSHHLVSISGGTKFKRISGPGVSFTGKLERLDQVFDLRLQIRGREIEVFSKDGIRYFARYFVAFRLDNEPWKKETYDTLRRLNPHLRGADKLTVEKIKIREEQEQNTKDISEPSKVNEQQPVQNGKQQSPPKKESSFPFNAIRVQAAQATTSTRVDGSDPIVYWDQWTTNVIEDQVRKILSQKNLDELWRPAEDGKFKNALDIIAAEIKNNSALILRAAGILLVAARVVNFRFPADDGKGEAIAEQQLKTWASEWERKRDNILAEARAEAERAQQEARAYAESILLNSIAEGLQRTHEINPNLPRFVIAMRFLSALQDYIHTQPLEGKDGEEIKRRMAELQNEFINWQERYHPGE